jgi:hypothetical protein
MKLKPIPGVDRFGASDAWMMFALWMLSTGHPYIAAFSATICGVICIVPDGVGVLRADQQFNQALNEGDGSYKP